MRHKYHWLVFPCVLGILAIAAFSVVMVTPSQTKSNRQIAKDGNAKKLLPAPKQADPKLVHEVDPAPARSLFSPSKVDVKHCHYFTDLSYEVSFQGALVYRFKCEVTNETSSPQDSLYIYLRCKSPGRTVPIAERIQKIDVAGGIEPGETKTVTFSEPVAFFAERQNDEPIEVAVVDGFSPQGKKPYQHLKGTAMVIAEFVERQDEGMGRLLDAEPN